MTVAPAPLTPDAVARAVLAVPGVVGLHPGTFGEVASYLPGRRVVGVRGDGRAVEVHVVLRWGAHVVATAEAVRRALTVLGADVVDVVVEDVAVVRADVPAADTRRPAGERTDPAASVEETT